MAYDFSGLSDEELNGRLTTERNGYVLYAIMLEQQRREEQRIKNKYSAIATERGWSDWVVVESESEVLVRRVD